MNETIMNETTMNKSELKLFDGALMFHPEIGAGMMFLWCHHEDPETPDEYMLTHRGGYSSPLDEGWSMVGHDGFAPKDAQLVWMSKAKVDLYEAVSTREDKIESTLQLDADEHVRLNPIQQPAKTQPECRQSR